MGLLERHGPDKHSTVRVAVTKSLRKAAIQDNIRKNVEAGANLYTDKMRSYQGLEADYIHGVIDHGEAYVRGKIHTNGLENFWSLLKRAIKGTYVSVEPFHLFRYLDEEPDAHAGPLGPADVARPTWSASSLPTRLRRSRAPHSR
jgi:transposase-like protein